jgi:hypothetical protein
MSNMIITQEFVRQEWQLTTRDRRKHEVALCWVHHIYQLHLLSKENIYHEFSRFREGVRSGRLICLETNLQERQDQDGRWWNFLVVQDKPHLIAIEPIATALKANGGGVTPLGTDPIALFEFGFLVTGFVYFFKKKKNRDAMFKFLNDMGPPAISQGCKVLIQGLVSKTELNGCRGRVVGCFNKESQRWPVRVIPKTGAPQELLLKVANIMLASAAPAAAVPASVAAAAAVSFTADDAASAATAAASATTTSGGSAIDRIPDLTKHGDDAHPPSH